MLKTSGEPGKQAAEVPRTNRALLGFLLFALFLVLGKALLVFTLEGESLGMESLTSTLIELLPAGVLFLPLVFLQALPWKPLRWISGLILGSLASFWVFAGLTLFKTGSPLDPGEILFVLHSPKEVLPAVLAETRWEQGLVLSLLFALFFFLGSGRPAKLGRTLFFCLLMILAGGLAQVLSPLRPSHPEVAASLLHRFFPGKGADSGQVSFDSYPALLPPPQGYWQAFRRSKLGGTKHGASRPNILLFFLESVRANATSVYNPSLGTTPFLARLAKRSLVAEHAYAFTNGTAKELFTAFSGHPPRLTREHVEAGRLPTGSGLPRELVRLGYQTVFFYAALEFHERQLLLMKDLGFQEHYTGPRLAHAFPEVLRFSKRAKQKLDNHRSAKELSILRNYYGYEDRSLVDPILKWIRNHKGKPWFLSTLNLTTHHPYHAPASWKRRHFPIPKDHPLPAEFQEYLNAVAYLDSVLEELFGRMEREGFLKNTIVILMGDHGESFKENGFFGHGHGLDENGVRVPLILFGPKALIGSPRKIGGLRSMLDLVPTIASLVGVKMPVVPSSPLRGKSLLESVPKERELFLAAWLNPEKTALFQNSRRYLFDRSFHRLEAYDLLSDPEEKKDLFSQLSPAFVERLWKREAVCRREIDRFFIAGEAAEIAKIRRKNLPSLAKKMHVRFGDSLLLEGVEAPEEVPFFGYGTLYLGFRVLQNPPLSTSLELRFLQKGAIKKPLCILDPNRNPPENWHKGDAILIPIPLFFPNFIVEQGPLELQLRVVEKARNRDLLPRRAKRGHPWVSLGRIVVRDPSWIPHPRSRETVLGERFEVEKVPLKGLHPSRDSAQSLLRKWERGGGALVLAGLMLHLHKDPAPLAEAYLKGTSKLRWKMIPLFERLGRRSVPLLVKFMNTAQGDRALPAAEALRRIGFSCLPALLSSLLPLEAKEREQVLSWVRGIQVDPGGGLQALFLEYLGTDLAKAVRAQILLSFAPRESVKMLKFGVPKVKEGESLERVLMLIRILGEQARELVPVLQKKREEVSEPWKSKIQATLERISPRLKNGRGK